MVELLSTPRIVPRHCEDLAELVRRATEDNLDGSSSFVPPSSHRIHAILVYLNKDNDYFEDYFGLIATLLTRRLDMTDINYTSVQTAKAIYVIQNLLLQTSVADKLVNHCALHIREINNLTFTNPRHQGDSPELIEAIRTQAREVVCLLTEPKQLEERRKFFRAYTPVLPPSKSNVDNIIREYTGPTEVTDPTGLLNIIRSRVSSKDDCEVVISMISRRLNILDINYECSHTLKALKITQHCLSGSDRFVNYWINNPEILIALSLLKCKHDSCDEDIPNRVHKLVADILARLDHHQQLQSQQQQRGHKATGASDSDLIRQRSVTPPPKSETPKLSMEDLKLDSFHIKDLTREIIRKSESPVAGGSYSDVFKERLQNGQEVAVKQLRMAVVKDRAKAIRNLQREVGVWSELSLADHPYLNPLLGITFSHYDQPSFVSPWHENGSIIDSVSKIPQEQRLTFFHKVVQAVAKLHHHRKKIIHGDIKPGNILLQHNLDPSLCDYGLSRIMDEAGLSTSGNAAGTFCYQAPELLEGERKSEASDIWALACVCYFLFAERDPYHHEGKASIITEIKKGPPAKPKKSKKGREMNSSLWKLLLDCWSLEPSKRPAVQALLERLEVIPNYGIHGWERRRSRETEGRNTGFSYD